MAMTTKTTTTWISLPDSPEFAAERKTWVDAAIEAGKTLEEDGIAQEDNELAFDRLWVDQAAAEEWETFIGALATEYGFEATVVISEV